LISKIYYRKWQIVPLLMLVIFLQSCAPDYHIRKTFTYPKPVDTHDKKISYQLKKVYQTGNVYADNRFDGARLNDFRQVNDTTYEVLVEPENSPINPSPWYAFNIWSEKPDSIYLKLKYQHARHRYTPKISRDRKHWEAIDNFTYNQDSTAILFKIAVSPEKQWIAAQKIINSKDTENWIDSLIQNRNLAHSKKIIGKSVLKRDIPFFVIGNPQAEAKNIIVLMSRQHPPEITGFEALQYFVDELTRSNHLTEKFYKEYSIWVFPILNPDGVDLGHWRHNANGIDLNRDWAYYRQPEIKAVTGFILQKAKEEKSKILLGIDFHSTFKDVFYIFDDTMQSTLPGFNKLWVTSINRIMAPFKTRISPYGATQPISKNWFYKQFKAEAMTYEIGDNTPATAIEKKARASAVTMMDLLINSRR